MLGSSPSSKGQRRSNKNTTTHGPHLGFAFGEGASAVVQANVFEDDGPEAYRALATKNQEHIHDVANT